MRIDTHEEYSWFLISVVDHDLSLNTDHHDGGEIRLVRPEYLSHYQHSFARPAVTHDIPDET